MTAPIHIIGQPGSGKTTLVATLVRNFTNKGFTVGTLKHSSHAHELDKPGKDSYIHRTAGACPATMVTSHMAAIYLPSSEDTSPENLIKTYYGNTDIVLIEGWISGPYPKVEIWRKAVERLPLFPDLPTVAALVSDDALPEKQKETAGQRQMRLLSLESVSALADLILDLRQS
jgi:molybdopterin-guanine dinucleotide biosynthesis adapter protein